MVKRFAAGRDIKVWYFRYDNIVLSYSKISNVWYGLTHAVLIRKKGYAPNSLKLKGEEGLADDQTQCLGSATYPFLNGFW